MCEISVVIPAYNAEKTISKTIESVLDQTFHDFELIIINDGSTDNTLAVISQFDDNRIKCFSYENSGPQKSRNRGLNKASGQYISFLDSDDLWTSDKLELQVRKLQESPGASVVYSWTNVIDEAGKFVRRGGYFSCEGDVFLRLFLINFLENGSNPLIKTESLRRLGGFDEEILAGQDWDIGLELANEYTFLVVEKPQILYRKSAISKSWSDNLDRQEMGFYQILNKNIARRPELQGKYAKAFLSNCYKYLVFESLKGPGSRQRSLKSILYLKKAISNEPSLLTKKVMLKVIMRITKNLLLSGKESRFLDQKIGFMFDISSLYGYLTTSI